MKAEKGSAEGIPMNSKNATWRSKPRKNRPARRQAIAAKRSGTVGGAR